MDLEIAADQPEFARAVALAGYFVAHGMWSASDGAPVVPMIVLEGPEGRSFRRFGGEDLGASARHAEQLLVDNPQGAIRAVLICDGYLDIDGVKHDALLARIVEYETRRRLSVVVPYRPAGSLEGFAVHNPRFGAAENLDGIDLGVLGRAFFGGVGAHVAAAPIWTAHLDQSI